MNLSELFIKLLLLQSQQVDHGTPLLTVINGSRMKSTVFAPSNSSITCVLFDLYPGMVAMTRKKHFYLEIRILSYPGGLLINSSC